MNPNNFQRMLDEDVERLAPEKYERIVSTVWGNLGFLRMLGDVADLYMSQMVGVMVMAAGGAGPETPSNANHIPPNTPDRPDQNGPIGGGPQSPEITR
ncbi:MAG TPA: hypothetical protein PLC89_04575 [Haliscomenobacter sp.]|uniref:hypothetical protein n=1 Tax=Haliscomenobacter sp. TaxID=2717303 RepID=UPI001D9BCA9F|nr:hypothetical protein [Haliscomenobacter sp.]MBK9487638.1 hypothetical protein [Haliscomenobacter sp.]HOY16541.1 hypothetical protein [Haliscomenobacter sp.]HPH20569.1 hypothetical protein [Haliscomenobacter sp.]